MEDKGSFVLYTEYMRQVDRLTDEQAGALFRAILRYASGGDLPELDAVTGMAFDFIQARMDRDAEQYRKTVEARREAGRSSGRSRSAAEKEAGTPAETEQKGTKRTNVNFVEQKRTKRTNEGESESESVHESESDSLKDSCAERSCDAGEKEPTEPDPPAKEEHIAASFILNDGSMYNVTEEDVAVYQQLYPGIDCMQELRKITGWSLSNPKNRKTRAGAKRFINSWLSRAQDASRPEPQRQQGRASPSNRFHNFDQRRYDYDAIGRQLAAGQRKEAAQ